MNVIDLFSGIGGFRLGMEHAGHTCMGFCEIDKFARKSYKAMYDTEGEVLMLTTKEFIEKVEDTGYKTEIDHRLIYIYKDEESFDRKIPCARINSGEQFGMICNGRLSSSEVFDYLTEYSRTPIDKRENKGYLWIKSVPRIIREVPWYEDDRYALEYDGEKLHIVFIGEGYEGVFYTESEKEEIERKTGVPLVFLEE